MMTAFLLAGCMPQPTEFDAQAAADTPACATEGIEVGECAPDFTLTDQNGEPFSLSDTAGLTVMSDFSGFT